jgi:DNA adenine methylase
MDVFIQKYEMNAVVSDVHTELIAFYKCIQDGNANDIYQFMQETPNNEETYYRVRDDMEITSELDIAKRFYYLRKTCFRGMMRYNKDGKFNIPFGKYKTINYEELLNPKYEELLKKTNILCEPFETIFKQYDDEHNFMFLDPPYDSEFTNYGYCSFDRNHHILLANYFKTTKNKCLMIIGKTPFIEELYMGYIVGEYQKKYKFKLYAGRIGDEINATHLVISNYFTNV